MCDDEECCPSHKDEHEKHTGDVECGGIGTHGHGGGRLIEARLLLLLRKKPSHGYELIERIDEFPLSLGSCSCDPGAIYRVLRSMEDEGLVTSKWDTGDSGPAKRTYKITEEGEERLFSWVLHLKKKKEGIEKFLKTYEKYGRR